MALIGRAMTSPAVIRQAGREGGRRRGAQDEGRYAASPLLRPAPRPSPLAERSRGGRSARRDARAVSGARRARSGPRGRLGGGAAGWPTDGSASQLRAGSLSVSRDTSRRAPSTVRCAGGVPRGERGMGGGGGGRCQALGPGRGEGISSGRQHGQGRRGQGRRGGGWRQWRVMRRMQQLGRSAVIERLGISLVISMGICLDQALVIGRLRDEAEARVVPARPHTGVSRQVGLEELGEAAESGLCGGPVRSESGGARTWRLSPNRTHLLRPSSAVVPSACASLETKCHSQIDPRV